MIASAGPPAERKSKAEAGFAAEHSDKLLAQLDDVTNNTPAAAAPDRLIIRTGDLVVRSGNPEEVGARAVGLVGAAGGYMVRREDNAYTFRVPAEKFDAVFEELARLGAVAHRRVDAQDVTEEVQNLELRLRNARALRDRYEELLKRAEKVEDVLAIQRELAAVTETIKRLEWQLQARMTEVKMSRGSSAARAPCR